MDKLVKPLFTIAAPSTSIYSGVKLSHPGGILTIYFDYKRDGKIYQSGLSFDKVRAYRYRAESHCTEWHIKEFYDTLSEIENSQWVESIKKDTPSDIKWGMKHYIIYFDSAGCYEIIASSWKELSEKEGRLENVF